MDSLIDLAFEVMSSAFVASHERTARIDEAYRSFSSGQNMSLERERQRSALLDWENRFLQAVNEQPGGYTLNDGSISAKDFGPEAARRMGQ